MPVHSVAIAQIYSVYAIQRHCGPIVSWGRFALSTEADWMFKEVGMAFNLAWARKCAVPREDHIFSKSDFKDLCAWKKKERKKENSLAYYDFIYLLFMFSITLFFFADQQFCSLLFLFLVRDRTQCTKLKNLCHWLGRVHVRCIILKKMYWNPC